MVVVVGMDRSVCVCVGRGGEEKEEERRSERACFKIFVAITPLEK